MLFIGIIIIIGVCCCRHHYWCMLLSSSLLLMLFSFYLVFVVGVCCFRRYCYCCFLRVIMCVDILFLLLLCANNCNQRRIWGGGIGPCPQLAYLIIYYLIFLLRRYLVTLVTRLAPYCYMVTLVTKLAPYCEILDTPLTVTVHQL